MGHGDSAAVQRLLLPDSRLMFVHCHRISALQSVSATQIRFAVGKSCLPLGESAAEAEGACAQALAQLARGAGLSAGDRRLTQREYEYYSYVQSVQRPASRVTALRSSTSRPRFLLEPPHLLRLLRTKHAQHHVLQARPGVPGVCALAISWTTRDKGLPNDPPPTYSTLYSTLLCRRLAAQGPPLRRPRAAGRERSGASFTPVVRRSASASWPRSAPHVDRGAQYVVYQGPRGSMQGKYSAPFPPKRDRAVRMQTDAPRTRATLPAPPSRPPSTAACP